MERPHAFTEWTMDYNRSLYLFYTSVNGHLKMRISVKDVLKYWTLHECLQQDLKNDNEQVG